MLQFTVFCAGEEVRKTQFPCRIWTVVPTWCPTAVR